MNVEINEENEDLRFVYLDENVEKVSQFISTFNKASTFALAYSIFFIVMFSLSKIYQIQKHIAIYFEHQQPNDPFSQFHELQMYSFNLHTLYAFLTVKVSFLLAWKAWQIKKQFDLEQFGIDNFKRGFTKVEDYTYFNLLLTLFCLVRYFEAGIVHIWLDLVSSIIGMFLGKLLEKQRQNIIHYSTQLKQQTQP